MSVSGISTSLPTDMFASLSPSAYAKKTKAQDTPGTPSSGSGSLSSTASGSTGSSTSGSATGKVVSGFADAASSLLQPSNSMSAAAANASDPSQPLNLSSLSHIYGGK